MVEGFEVIPAVDIRGGTVVQLVGGEPGTDTEYGNPVHTAQHWVEAGAKTLHIVDLDGAIDGVRRNHDAITRIVDTVDVRTQVGGGIRSVESAKTLLDAGVDRVVLGTAAIEDPGIVASISDTYPEGVVVSLDASDGEVVVEGWTEGAGVEPARVANAFEANGAAAILFTDVDVEGRAGGVRPDPLESVVEAVSIPVIASGGVATIEDLRTVRDVGAGACVVGTALYEGAFTLQAAIDGLAVD